MPFVVSGGVVPWPFFGLETEGRKEKGKGKPDDLV